MAFTAYGKILDPPPKDRAIDFQTWTWLNKSQMYISSVTTNALWRNQNNQATVDYRTTHQLNQTYDQGGNTVAMTEWYQALSPITIPVLKELDIFRFDVIFSPTGPSGNARCINVNSYNQGTGEVNNVIAYNKTTSAGISKSVYGRTEANGAGANGSVIVGLVGATTVSGGAVPNTTWPLQLSHSGPADQGIWLNADNAGDTLQHGFVLSGNTALQQAMIQYNQRAGAPGSFLRFYDGTATNIFDVDSGGWIKLGGVGQRFQADFSNSTNTNRLFFQSITTNGNTSVGAIPNGTSVTANFRALSNSNPAAALNMGQFSQVSNITVMDASVLNGGTQGTMELRIGGAQAVTINADKSAKCFSLGRAVATKTTNYTATKVDSVLFVDATSGNVTITLPGAADFGAGYSVPLRIKRKDASANTVTIQRAGSDTIDNALTSFTLPAWGAVQLESDGVSLWGRF